MVSQFVLENLNILALFIKLPTNAQKCIIQIADDKLLACMCEICHNILKGRVKLTSSEFYKLKKLRAQFHRLSTVEKIKRERAVVREQLIKKAVKLPRLAIPIILRALKYRG